MVPLPRPRGVQPPTLLRSRGGSRPFTALVQTYSTVPYADLDPTPFAAAAYVVMFGLMFGDVGHGLLLVLLAALARAGRPHVLARLRPAVPLVAAAGVASMIAGALYGEFFGPTGLVAPLWLAPLEDPMRLLVAGLAVGALLLAVAYAIGTANRVREGGWSYALYAPSGLAGVDPLPRSGAARGRGSCGGPTGWCSARCVVAVLGLALSFVGLYAGSGGGGSGVAEAVVELVDLVVRLGSNVVSFARLAAFGLTHAALGAVVWGATTALWLRGGAAVVAAVVVFLVGNAVAFALEALVAAVQALRLEYYELFSRVFEGEGRPFRPWHLPLAAVPAAAPEPLPSAAAGHRAARPPDAARRAGTPDDEGGPMSPLTSALAARPRDGRPGRRRCPGRTATPPARRDGARRLRRGRAGRRAGDRGGGGLGWTGRGGSVRPRRVDRRLRGPRRHAGRRRRRGRPRRAATGGRPCWARRSRWPAPRSVPRSPSPTPAQPPSRR